MGEREVSVDPARAVLLGVAGLHAGLVVFTESFHDLPAVAAAYAAAWWVVGRGGTR